MQTAKLGDRVLIEYIGTLENGRIFDSRDQNDRLEIELGRGEVFTALEEQIVGMREGEVKNTIIPPEQAYGPRLKENMLKLPRNYFPTGKGVQLGQKINLEFRDGQQRVMLVVELSEDTVVLDGNHFLAGCELTFALKLVAVQCPDITKE